MAGWMPQRKAGDWEESCRGSLSSRDLASLVLPGWHGLLSSLEFEPLPPSLGFHLDSVLGLRAGWPRVKTSVDPLVIVLATLGCDPLRLKLLLGTCVRK